MSRSRHTRDASNFLNKPEVHALLKAYGCSEACIRSVEVTRNHDSGTFEIKIDAYDLKQLDIIAERELARLPSSEVPEIPITWIGKP